tara:strand:- start:323 stop:1306 length:984 start_codon:yes stop_codon:yes gene_type:complete
MEVEKQLFPIFSSFLRDLSKTYPEIKNSLYRNYEDCIMNEEKSLKEFPKLVQFMQIINDNEKLITDKNVVFFDSEIDILEEISFKLLWEKNISNKTRESIWKYLQTFQIININLKSNEQLRLALSQIGTDTVMEVSKDTAKDLKKLKNLTSKVKEEAHDDESGLDEMLGGLMDSGIGDIAKEVAESLDMESMFGSVDENTNPMEIMAKLMNPDKMGEIFKNINSVMEKKVESGEMTRDSLKGEADGVMGKMSSNPMFANMMSQLNPNLDNNGPGTAPAPAPGTAPATAPGTGTDTATDTATAKSTELSKEEKQLKLRNKIKEKRDSR